MGAECPKFGTPECTGKCAVNNLIIDKKNNIVSLITPSGDIASIDSEPLLDTLSNKSRTGRSEEVQKRFRDQGGQ